MDLNQAYQQLNHCEATFKILQMEARNEVFQYQELNANTATQCSDDEMPPCKAPIKQMIKNL